MHVSLRIHRKEREVIEFLLTLRKVLGEDVFDFQIEDWDFWSESELKSLGKIAHHPESFAFGDEVEDYSQW